CSGTKKRTSHDRGVRSGKNVKRWLFPGNGLVDKVAQQGGGFLHGEMLNFRKCSYVFTFSLAASRRMFSLWIPSFVPAAVSASHVRFPRNSAKSSESLVPIC